MTDGDFFLLTIEPMAYMHGSLRRELWSLE
jgi:hypothetical protein